ncbi:MAG: pyruvate ferredoxin oxidoreductase [Clostridiaceae bacterium]|nr:pyruvate ferredoxin oxidoreductase [Clostridiaceae bacterium]
MTKHFLSGNEAFAYGVSLAKPDIISAYPITPQTIVVERLAEMVEDGSLKSEFIHVESEHSALSCAIGASAAGVRAFTATSSQGLLYMAECLPYASGGRFPLVMMNANRSTALPWNIYGDQRDSILMLDSGWIQVYAETAQESLDLALLAFYIAEDSRVMTPVMVNLDGFVLTHTYEVVDVPSQELVEEFLPPYETENKLDMDSPKNLGYSVGPDYNTEFKYLEHIGVQNAANVIVEAENRFAEVFGRSYPGLVDTYLCEDAEYIMITLGTIAGLCRETADLLRSNGIKAGVLRLRYIRPFPNSEVAEALKNVKAVGVLEKDISFGNEGTIYTNVNSALYKVGLNVPSYNFIGGLGGRDITKENIEEAYKHIIEGGKKVNFIGLGVNADE